jgi:hypothetical protein
MHSPNTVCETHAAEAVTMAKGTTSALKSLGQKHSEAPCAMLASQSISMHQETSSSTTVKLTPTSQHSRTARCVAPWFMSSTINNQTTKELLIATQHASGKEAVGVTFILGNAKVVAEQHHLRPPPRALGRAPRVARRGRSDAPSTLTLWLAATVAMRKLTTLVRSMSRQPDVISSTRHSSPKTISRNFSKQPIQITYTLLSTSSRTEHHDEQFHDIGGLLQR